MHTTAAMHGADVLTGGVVGVKRDVMGTTKGGTAAVVGGRSMGGHSTVHHAHRMHHDHPGAAPVPSHMPVNDNTGKNAHTANHTNTGGHHAEHHGRPEFVTAVTATAGLGAAGGGWGGGGGCHAGETGHAVPPHSHTNAAEEPDMVCLWVDVCVCVFVHDTLLSHLCVCVCVCVCVHGPLLSHSLVHPHNPSPHSHPHHPPHRPPLLLDFALPKPCWVVLP